MSATIRSGDLVRINRGKKVYRVSIKSKAINGGAVFYLEADALHPDAAKRVPDAFRWYRPEELTLVEEGGRA